MTIERADPTPATNQLLPAAANALFEGLRELDRACGPDANKHHRATVLISACIDEGINTGSSIIGALRHLGFNPKHIGIVLHDGTGSDPSRHHWQRDEAGTYRNLT